MRFKGLDLNLLVVLDALLTARNLTAAASSINLSQPAMSAAVARLRNYFNDELFTMSGRERVLTPRAETLAPAVRGALLHIQCSIISWDPFNPAQSDRRFRIILSDFATLVFFEKVVERVAREAPAVSFELRPLDNDPDELLRRGDVDFVILPEFFMSSAHPRAALFDETFVCVGCPTNKQLPRQLTFERYVSMKHIAFRVGGAQMPSIEEQFLLEHGLKRRVEIVVQAFSMIPPMVSGTARIATMPFRLVQHFKKTFPLRIIELPRPLPTFTEAVQWPTLHNSDPASIWMRQIMLQEASRM
ncbi:MULTISPECIES: LysR family transcriptional regulator [Mesorhizobium]|uniref:Nodulation protein D 3 n=1 Tax=Mesorhizobium japonicum (strain LMG 29417 / CECT 9101 / MAFF 303099) TaxID=266835 RepID=NODD3_RHILO|nr:MULTISPECIES: LysR family transcriptional regulator [Mesorhizobium]Q52779.2 RecName: Full=Nodulation protein D 3 [Mesorhizobium japonicum MAFF 303099]BAV50346.1 LysR family transcriptional regulator [Mesorhizobium loti]BAB52515.1 transcriptional regulator, nudulation protein; NodD [Mesorhizobium japonicum MAFF 303099]BCG75983.1 LysR family transcriptional regulator [Mesorhizobium sp. 113-1-2]BCG82745.1 LysR family transcriptional regulator [Mesorhizobium sp. 113-3-3]BCG90622.1 LysR family 